MPTYRHDGRTVHLDIDLGLGREYGYRDPARPPHPAPCHPLRPVYARGLCRFCYLADRRTDHDRSSA